MCHTAESRPPASTEGGSPRTAGPVVLQAADGNRFSAHAARSRRPSGTGVVVLPDVRGLHDFYRELAERFAGVGVDAVAVDYFGRTAGTEQRDESFPFREHAEKTTATGVTADIAAASSYLRSPQGGSVSSVFTVGFCFGGGHSWRLAAELPGLCGAIGFYGRPALAASVVGRPHAPLLLLAAGADAQIPLDDVTDFTATVVAAGGDADLVVFDGAPHSFFDRSWTEQRQACERAWEQVLHFLGSRAG